MIRLKVTMNRGAIEGQLKRKLEKAITSKLGRWSPIFGVKEAVANIAKGFVSKLR